MTIKSGFFNSEGGDRKYDAEDINKFFSGVITDGVLSTIGDTLLVVPSSGMQVAIGSGKAWFLKSWIENTSDAFRTLSDSDVTYDRIDIIAIDFDKSDQVRENDIIIVEGTPAGSPVPPTLIDISTHLQKPLAHILVEANATVIDAGDITSKVDTVDCPFSTGITDLVVSVDDVTIEIVSNDLQVKDDGITGAKIANDQIDSEHIVADSIDSEHYAPGSVDKAAIGAGQVDTSELAADAVTGAKIEDDAIDSEHYAPGSVDGAAIGTGQVDTSELANNSVDDTKVGNRVPMLTRRQGGSSTIWGQFGNNNYTPTTVKMQAGNKLTDATINPGNYSTLTITFPQAFSYTPIVFVQPSLVDFHHGFTSISASGFTVQVKNDGPGAAQPSIHWLAIGPE